MNTINLFNAQLNSDGEVGDLYRGLGFSFDTMSTDKYFIKKYQHESGNSLSSDIPLMRAADLHLLFAEALNRMGDTTVAMIVLNDGMKNTKRPKPNPQYTNWNKNLGIRGRVGLWNVEIPPMDDASKILFIEDRILDERAMELAFEGRRWFDLMRIARRRNDPSYLANRVASKFSDPAKADNIRSLLSNPQNWYLPKDY
ncbi:MAG: RagB/SusD family nutrient uptake outer membrane protein [Bacteroidales bacterium]|nr:RagB/SusD family nutrient uptake outer membrane protein [Bacteroidales bacterium]